MSTFKSSLDKTPGNTPGIYNAAVSESCRLSPLDRSRTISTDSKRQWD